MKTAGIVLFDDVEPVTFTDAIALFCARRNSKTGTPHSLFQPLLIAQCARPVTCSGGFHQSNPWSFGRPSCVVHDGA